MAVFNTNQARQVYVVKSGEFSAAESANSGTKMAVYSMPNLEGIYFKTGKIQAEEFTGGSDKIYKDKVLYANYTTAEKMQRKLAATKITLNDEVSKELVSGQDYILTIVFKNYFCLGENDTYVKQAMVHAYTGMTSDNFYKVLAKSLIQNFSREASKPLNIGLIVAGGQYQEVKTTSEVDSITGGVSALILTEADPTADWIRGTKQIEPLHFEVQFVPITVSGDERSWGIAEKYETSKVLKNGPIIADMEYFYLGERGDQYRNMGWPNVIPTEYKVDPSKEYDVIDIHYYDNCSNEAIQKSEKTLTIFAEAGEGLTVKSAIEPLGITFNTIQ